MITDLFLPVSSHRKDIKNPYMTIEKSYSNASNQNKKIYFNLNRMLRASQEIWLSPAQFKQRVYHQTINGSGNLSFTNQHRLKKSQFNSLPNDIISAISIVPFLLQLPLRNKFKSYQDVIENGITYRLGQNRLKCEQILSKTENKELRKDLNTKYFGENKTQKINFDISRDQILQKVLKISQKREEGLVKRKQRELDNQQRDIMLKSGSQIKK